MSSNSSPESQKALSIAKAYGTLQRAITDRANAERIKVAQLNFNTERGQIEQQRSERVSELSNVFRQHTASIVSNAIFRGVGGGSIGALIGSADAEAEVARRNIDINANNAVGAAAVQADVPLEDPTLSQLQGTFQGLSIGSDFVTSLAELPTTTQRGTDWVSSSLGYQAVPTTRQVQGTFDVRTMFPELDNFLRGA